MKNGRERFKSKALLKKKNKTNKDIKHEMASLESKDYKLMVCVCVCGHGVWCPCLMDIRKPRSPAFDERRQLI